MDLRIFLFIAFLLNVDLTLVLGEQLVINQTLVSCDGTGMVAKVFDVNLTYYSGSAYAQVDDMSTNYDLCGPGGTAFSLDDTEWTYNITFEDMEAGRCGTYQSNETHSEYSVLLVVPRRDLIHVVTDHRTIMICRWRHVETWNVINKISAPNPLPDTDVSRSDGSLEGPTVHAMLLNSTDNSIVGRIGLGDRVKLNLDLAEETGEFWTRLLIINLTATPVPNDDAIELPIIQNGCPDTDILEYINGSFEGDNENDPPVNFIFDAFRFHEDVTIAFNITVRVCTTEQACSVTCPNGDRKKREIGSDQFNSMSFVNHGTINAHPTRKRRAENRSKTATDGSPDGIEVDHVDVGLQIIATVDSEDDLGNKDKSVNWLDDNSILVKESDKENFRIVNQVGKTEQPPIEIKETNLIACLNQTQLIVICVLAVLMLLVTAGSTAFSCCKLLANHGESRRYRRVSLQNEGANQQGRDIGNFARCSDCGCCIAPVGAKCPDCGCCKVPSTQQKLHTGGDGRDLRQQPGFHYGLHKDNY